MSRSGATSTSSSWTSRCRERQDIPIIFVTAIYTEEPWIRKGYEVGGIDYFSKPFDPEILKMKVAVYASFRRKADFLKERERHSAGRMLKNENGPLARALRASP